MDVAQQRHRHKNSASPDARLERRENSCEFRVTGSKDPDADETRPVLMARGHVDG